MGAGEGETQKEGVKPAVLRTSRRGGVPVYPKASGIGRIKKTDSRGILDAVSRRTMGIRRGFSDSELKPKKDLDCIFQIEPVGGKIVKDESESFKEFRGGIRVLRATLEGPKVQGGGANRRTEDLDSSDCPDL